MAKVSFFEKMKKVEAELKFCEKKLKEKKEDESLLRAKIEHHKISSGDNGQAAKKMAYIRKEIESIPKKKAHLILSGKNTDGKEVTQLDNILRVFYFTLAYL